MTIGLGAKPLTLGDRNMKWACFISQLLLLGLLTALDTEGWPG